MFRKCCLLVLCTVFAITAVYTVAAYGQGDEGKEQIAARPADVDPARVDAAVKKACEWLKSQQQADGHWAGKNQHLDAPYPNGVTALCLYALLKSGFEDKDSNCVKKGFGFLRPKQFVKVYDVSCLILALTALWQPPPPMKEISEEEKKDPEKMRTSVFEPYEKKLKKNFRKKVPKWAMDWLKKAVAWTVQQQQANVWRYPGNHGAGPVEDASNSQYAMLALYSAMRVGVSVPKKVFSRAATYFLVHQEKDGPEVKGFPVPAADFDIAKLKQLEKDMLEKMKEIAEQNKKIAKDAKKAGEKTPELDSPSTTVVMEDPYRKYGGEPRKMRARGWAYTIKAGVMAPEMQKDWTTANGSMTTSGVAALVICKEQIEKGLKSGAKKKINQAIRDGLAWMVHNWSVSKNPDCGTWHKYWLYGIERAAVLSLCYKLGEHKWYKEGAEYLLGNQSSAGSWPADSEKVTWFRGQLGYGENVSTCFAVLFLKRATVPIIKPPRDIYTGEGLFGGSPPKK
jgi:hypothetical protein